ncbi:hypothetical protein ACJZ2D_015784 [Fusarium nematophilum]
MTTYQVDIPREGLAQPYLMRMIMSLSSFHLAYLNKDKRAHYLLLANKHQILAVRGLRGALTRAVTPQNCHALWVSSIFLAISKFAFTPTYEHHQGSCSSALLNLVNIFSMISGIVAIMRSSQELIRTGPFQGIFSQRLGFQYSRSDLRDLLQSVSDLNKTVKSWGLDPDPNIQLALTSALESLDSCVADISNSPDYGSFPAEIKILFVWPSRLSQTFLDLIKASHPLAVIVLAHYCCLIRWSGPAYWFCRGWGRPLADCVMSILEDSEWAHLAEWPVKVMATGVAIGSSIQIALLVTPLLVVLGWAMNVPMSLNFNILEIIIFAVSVLVVTGTVQDGKSNYLEGAMLVGLYIIIALTFWAIPSGVLEKAMG